MRQTLDAFAAALPAYLATPARVLLILFLAAIALRFIPRLISRVRKAVQDEKTRRMDLVIESQRALSEGAKLYAAREYTASATRLASGESSFRTPMPWPSATISMSTLSFPYRLCRFST